MRSRLDSRGGTFTDVACCLKTSCSALRPVIRRCWPERGGLADTRDFFRDSAVPQPCSRQCPYRAAALIRCPRFLALSPWRHAP